MTEMLVFLLVTAALWWATDADLRRNVRERRDARRRAREVRTWRLP